MTNKEKRDALTRERMELDAQLKATDYQVIKSAEATVLGHEQPYNMEELHATRQAWRDKINRIDKMLEVLIEDEPAIVTEQER